MTHVIHSLSEISISTHRHRDTQMLRQKDIHTHYTRTFIEIQTLSCYRSMDTNLSLCIYIEIILHQIIVKTVLVYFIIFKNTSHCHVCTVWQQLLSTRGKCFKTFFLPNLQISVISQGFGQTRLEKIATDKHSTFLQKLINFRQKCFITLAPGQISIVSYRKAKSQ